MHTKTRFLTQHTCGKGEQGRVAHLLERVGCERRRAALHAGTHRVIQLRETRIHRRDSQQEEPYRLKAIDELGSHLKLCLGVVTARDGRSTLRNSGSFAKLAVGHAPAATS